MERRGFLASILAASVAPFVVTRAGVLMPTTKIWTSSTDVVTAHDVMMEGWIPLTGGERWLESGDSLCARVRVPEWHSNYAGPLEPVFTRGFRATSRTLIAGTLHGQAGRFERGIFIPADVTV